MNAKKFSDAMSELDSKYIDEALNYNAQKHSRHFRRVPVALVAIILTLFLMGAGVVAAIIYGDSIQSWFSYYWNEITGQSMSKEQTAVIDHLSQDIGIGKTIGNVTITVDSATVGDDSFFLLVRIEGLDFSDRNSYGFEHATMEMIPNLIDDGGIGGFGTNYLGIDESGSALLLFDYSYASYTDFTPNAKPLEITLMLQNVIQNPNTDRQKVLSEGQWFISFVLDRSQLPEVVSLPDTEIIGTENSTGKEVPITITDIELTNTGLRFQYAYDNGNLFLSSQDIKVILKSGSVIGNNGGVGSPTNGNQAIAFSYQWVVPINLDEVVAVRIGENDISIPN